jgi:predicted dienelactone hydrolase
MFTKFISRAAVLSVVIALQSGCASVPAPAFPVVGTATLAVQDPARGRKLDAEIWFRASDSTEVSGYSVFLPIRALPIAKDSEPMPEISKKPLVVLSHGNWGTPFSLGWLAADLVRAGYVVVTLSHPGTSREDRTDLGAFRLWDRAKDASLVLDKVLATPKWAALLDANRIAFVGHSFGGFTGVSLAGGLFDIDEQQRLCKAAPKDYYCNGFNQMDTSGFDRSDAKLSYRDARFKAFYIMAAGPAGGFSKASLAAIEAPFFVDTAKDDEILTPSDNADIFARTLPHAKAITREVGHFTYVPECKPVLGSLFASRICSDPSGVDRRQVHGVVSESVRTFLSQALAPEALAGAR